MSNTQQEQYPLEAKKKRIEEIKRLVYSSDIKIDEIVPMIDEVMKIGKEFKEPLQKAIDALKEKRKES